MLKMEVNVRGGSAGHSQEIEKVSSSCDSTSSPSYVGSVVLRRHLSFALAIHEALLLTVQAVCRLFDLVVQKLENANARAS